VKNNTYPLDVPPDLLKDLRKVAQQTGLSMSDTMRQSMKLGLPSLVERLSPDPLKNLQPFTQEETRRCFGRPEPEFDALAAHCAALPVPIPDA
jgi:hypothetical protein